MESENGSKEKRERKEGRKEGEKGRGGEMQKGRKSLAS